MSDVCGVCNGNGIRTGDCNCFGAQLDCKDVCGGDTVYDICEVCGGNGIPEGHCDCLGNVMDCEGVCGGTTVRGECGECLVMKPEEKLIPGVDGQLVV